MHFQRVTNYKPEEDDRIVSDRHYDSRVDRSRLSDRCDAILGG
jgi:hypothetical protein